MCVPHKTEFLNLSVFNMITGKNESKTLRKHISCECKCNFDETKCKSNQLCNKDKWRCECKKHHICEKDYVCNPVRGNCENGKYLSSIMDDSTIIRDQVIESYDKEMKVISKHFNENKATCKTQSFYILLAFLLITIVLLIVVSIYCYLIKYQRIHWWPFHSRSNKLNKFYIDSVDISIKSRTYYLFNDIINIKDNEPE